MFRDERYIGNSKITPCNRVLKRRILERRILKKEYLANTCNLIFGISNDEEKRKIVIEKKWLEKGVNTIFPFFIDKTLININNNNFFHNFGIYSPRLYRLGFSHNNCGGACVKAGISQWKKLYEIFPERYKWHENQEKITQEFLGKNVSILRDRSGGKTTPLSLRKLRETIENGGIK